MHEVIRLIFIIFFRYQGKKTDLYSAQSNMITLILLFVVLFYVAVSLIILLSRTDEFYYLRAYDKDATSGMNFFKLVILYSQMIPMTLFLVLDITALLMKFLVEHSMIKE